MSNVYDEQKKAYRMLERKIFRAFENNEGVADYDSIIYDLTMDYAVSEKSMRKRVELMAKKHDVKMKDGKLYNVPSDPNNQEER